MNPEKAEGLSPELQRALEPLLSAIEELSQRIREYNERIEALAQESYPRVALLKQIKGVGTLIALTYMLTCELRCGLKAAPFQQLAVREFLSIVFGLGR